MGSNQKSNRTIVDRAIDVARRLLGLPPKQVLVPVPVRNGRPVPYRERSR
jgi:hypothetical protein